MEKTFERYLALAGVIEERQARRVQLEAELDDLKVELDALKPVLDERIKPLLERCRIPVIIAIREFNATSDRFLGENIKSLTIDHTRLTVNVSTTLKHPDGREPYDVLDDDDSDWYADKIRARVDTEFQKSDLPFMFGTIRFPGSYYLRLA